MNEAVAALAQLPGQLEPFLAAWTAGMRRAGYLEHTTAKRDDCIRSFLLFVEPMLQVLGAGGGVPEFKDLLREPAWADGLLETARRHRFRGVTQDMFMGCFKTMVHAMGDQLDHIQADDAARLGALRIIRRFADAYETLLVAEWAVLSQREADDRYTESNRLLTLEKNKYENILAAISDLVLVVDGDGVVLESNRAACAAFGGRLGPGQPIWAALGLEGESMPDLLRYYPPQQAHEIHISGAGPQESEHYFELMLIPLSLVSLASTGYILVLNDITVHVLQRSTLERVVDERTEDLRAEKARLQEMNITLRQVMGLVEQDREADRQSLAHTVETVLLPALDRVRREASADGRKGYLDLLEDQLVKLAPGVGPDGDARLLKLTPMEIKICRFVRAGSSTKDIAESLHLSPGTIQSHRKNIRKKLGLQGQDVNLSTYLQSFVNAVE